jgi:predicted ABC-type exoprotein transport system permease subunit
VVAANLVVGIVVTVVAAPFADAIVQSTTSAVLLAGFLLLALSLTGKLPRWQQTGTAAFGADTVFGVLTLLLMLAGEALPFLKEPAWLLLLALLLWQAAVLGQILRHALNVPLVAGAGLSLAYFIVSFRILTSLFPLAE